jgi:hypothetical protein
MISAAAASQRSRGNFYVFFARERIFANPFHPRNIPRGTTSTPGIHRAVMISRLRYHGVFLTGGNVLPDINPFSQETDGKDSNSFFIA